MYGVQPEQVRQWDRVIQFKGSLTFADWKTAALDSSEVMQDAEEPTLPVTQQMLAAAQLHGKYVVDEYRALQKRAHIEQEESNDKINKLQKAREELQKAVEELQKAVEEQGEAVNVLEKELHETRATCAEAQQAAQLKTTELEANSQFTKDLQEQLSRLTEMAAIEQSLQAKTAEVVSLHDKATASEQQSHDLTTKNSRLEQEVGHLKKSLADVTQLNSKMSQAQDDITEGLQTQLVKLRREKDASDRALQSKHGDFQSAQDGAAASQASLSETRRRCIELKQELSSLKDSLAEAHTTKECEAKSAQLAQQDAELAAAKQMVASRLAAHQELARVATDRSHELQEHLGRTTIDLHAAKAQIRELQTELAGKCDEVTNDKRTLAALQNTHRASVKMLENSSAQLQQQLARKGTDLSSAEQSLVHLQQELSQAPHSKHEAIKEAQKHSVQLQKQLDRKVTDLGSLQHKLAGLHAELGKMTKAKEDGMEKMGSLKSQLRAALADRDDAIQELSEWRNKMEGMAAKAQGRGQGLAARLAASGTSLQSDRSNGPSSPATPPDQPKGRPSVFTRLSHVPAPTSQASTDQGAANCGGVGVLDAPRESDMPPGFGRSLPASTGKGKGPIRMPNLDEAFGDSLPLVKQMVPKLVGLAEQLGKLHEDGLVHQAVHKHFVLVGQEGDWKLARLEKAAHMDSSLDKPMMCDGIEAPEMAQQQHKAGYYYPDPKQDMWSFGLLLFSFFKRMGQLPHKHQIAIRDGTTLLFASKLRGRARYTEWQHKIERTLKQGKLNPELIRIVLGCLAKDPDQRFTAARVVADLTEFIHKKGW